MSGTPSSAAGVVPAQLLLVATAGLSSGLLFVPAIWESPLRIPTVVALLGVAPGYALVSAIAPAIRTDAGTAADSTGGSDWPNSADSSDEPDRPDERGFGSVERLSYSIATNVVLVALIGVSLRFTRGGIRLEPLLLALGGLSVALAIVAALRWRSYPPELRASFRPRRHVGSATPIEGNSPLAISVVVLVVLIAGGSVAYAVTASNAGDAPGELSSPLEAFSPSAQSPQFTEFSLLTENESGGLVMGDYPTSITAGENRSLVVGLHHRDRERTEYTVVALLERLDDGEDGEDAGTVTERRELRRFSATLDRGENWRRQHEISPATAGERLRLRYLLYRGSAPSSPSVETASDVLSLRLSVSEPATPPDGSAANGTAPPGEQAIPTAPPGEQAIPTAPPGERAVAGEASPSA